MAKKFTAANFDQEVLQADQPVLVDFYADWCGPCKMMAPVIDQLEEECSGKAVIGKLNIDDELSIAERYQVMTIPTLAVFKNGKLVNKAIGVTAKEDLKAMLLAD